MSGTAFCFMLVGVCTATSGFMRLLEKIEGGF